MNPNSISPTQYPNLSESRWRYTVTATLENEHAQNLYLDWLFAGHVDEVCRWAEEAEVFVYQDKLHPDRPLRYQVQSIYWFTNQLAFQKYEREGAPALRTEGIGFAKTLGGIQFERKMGRSWMVNRLESLS